MGNVILKCLCRSWLFRGFVLNIKGYICIYVLYRTFLDLLYHELPYFHCSCRSSWFSTTTEKTLVYWLISWIGFHAISVTFQPYTAATINNQSTEVLKAEPSWLIVRLSVYFLPVRVFKYIWSRHFIRRVGL